LKHPEQGSLVEDDTAQKGYPGMELRLCARAVQIPRRLQAVHAHSIEPVFPTLAQPTLDQDTVPGSLGEGQVRVSAGHRSALPEISGKVVLAGRFTAMVCSFLLPCL
jgi:hypothetical protein